MHEQETGRSLFTLLPYRSSRLHEGELEPHDLPCEIEHGVYSVQLGSGQSPSNVLFAERTLEHFHMARDLSSWKMARNDARLLHTPVNL